MSYFKKYNYMSNVFDIQCILGRILSRMVHVYCAMLSVAKNQNETPTHDSSLEGVSHGQQTFVKTERSEQSSVEQQSEVCSAQPASEFLECNGEVKQDDCTSQTENTELMPVNGNNPDSLGNSTAEPANNGKQDSSLLRHWQLKYPGRKIEPHTCTTCGKQFLQAVQLRKHMIKHASADDKNSMEFPYTCYVCRRHFLFANDLRRHLISHSDDRPYSCVVCTRPFKREDDLTKHMKTHGDVRPYRCEQCSEQLESSSKLRKHLRKVHGDRFECTRCRVFLYTRSQLSKHKREFHTGLYTTLIPCYVATLPQFR